MNRHNMIFVNVFYKIALVTKNGWPIARAEWKEGTATNSGYRKRPHGDTSVRQCNSGDKTILCIPRFDHSGHPVHEVDILSDIPSQKYVHPRTQRHQVRVHFS